MKLSGVTSNTASIYVNMIFAFVNFVFTIVGMRFVDHYGRRPLTLYSLWAVSVTLIMLAFAFGANAHVWVVVTLVAVYLAVFAPGLGTMPWCICSEVFPDDARAACVSISTAVNWTSNLVVSLTFLSISEALSPAGAFGLYGFVGLVGLTFLRPRLPETKGKSLDKARQLWTRS